MYWHQKLAYTHHGDCYVQVTLLCGKVKSRRRIREVEKSAGRNRTKNKRVKTKYMRPTHCQDKIYLLRERVPIVDTFVYLGSTIQSDLRMQKRCNQ